MIKFKKRYYVIFYWAVIIALLGLYFTNDFGLVDLHKTSVIVAVGIDAEDEDVIVTAQVAVPQPSQSGENIQYTQVQGRGLTVADCLNEINSKTGFYPKLLFCKLIRAICPISRQTFRALPKAAATATTWAATAPNRVSKAGRADKAAVPRADRAAAESRARAARADRAARAEAGSRKWSSPQERRRHTRRAAVVRAQPYQQRYTACGSPLRFGWNALHDRTEKHKGRSQAQSE